MAEVINLNNTTPAAPSGSVNVQFQKGASTGTDPATGLPINPVSASVAFIFPATTGAPSSTPVPGAAAFDSSAKKLWVYDGSDWVGTVLS